MMLGHATTDIDTNCRRPHFVDLGMLQLTVGARAGIRCNGQRLPNTESDEGRPCALLSVRGDRTLNTNYVVSVRGWCMSVGSRFV
jgi:hypothetical protein